MVQPVTRTLGDGDTEGMSYHLIASVHCKSGTFGRITLHQPTRPVIVYDDIHSPDPACSADHVAQPLTDLLTAIGDHNVPSIRTLVYTPTVDELINIRRLGEYSFLMPDGDVLRRGDATSFPGWITDTLASGWTLIPLELYWSNTVPTTDRPDGGTVAGMAGATFFFLMVNERTDQAWRGIWKGVVIDCEAGTILSLHGGTA